MFEAQSGELILGDVKAPATLAMEEARLRLRVFDAEGTAGLRGTAGVELAHFRGNRNAFTLLTLQHLRSEARLGVGGVTTYSVRLAIEDVLFDNVDDISAVNWDLYVEDLAKIIHVTGLHQTISYDESGRLTLGWLFQTASPLVLACPRSRLEVRIGQDMRTTGDPIAGPGMSFRYVARCVFDEEVQLYPALARLNRIRLFFSLLMGRVLGIEAVSLRLADEHGSHDAKVYGLLPTERTDEPASRLVDFGSSADLARMLDEWLVRFDELSEAIHLHLDGLEQRRLPIHLRFQIFIQALEALHRRTVAGDVTEPIDVDAVQEVLRERGIEQSVVDRVSGVLAHAHEPGLRQRMRGYWDQLADELAILRPDARRSDFIGRAVATRNHFAHRTDLNEQVLTGPDLWDWTETIKAMSHMSLLSEIGGDVTGLGRAMLDRRFAQYVIGE